MNVTERQAEHTKGALIDLATTIDATKDLNAIDWVKLKPILALLMKTLGPILLQILIDAITPKPAA